MIRYTIYNINMKISKKIKRQNQGDCKKWLQESFAKLDKSSV